MEVNESTVELMDIYRRAADMLVDAGHDAEAVTAAMLGAAVGRAVAQSGTFAVANDLILMAVKIRDGGQSTARKTGH